MGNISFKALWSLNISELLLKYKVSNTVKGTGKQIMGGQTWFYCLVLLYHGRDVFSRAAKHGWAFTELQSDARLHHKTPPQPKKEQKHAAYSAASYPLALTGTSQHPTPHS